MPTLIRIVFQVLLIVSASTVALKTAKAQDPLKVDPEHYTLLYENTEVRVLKYDDTPGHVVPKHSHPQYKVYVITPSTRQFFLLNPATHDCAQEGDTKSLIPNNNPPWQKPITHCEKNAGTTDAHMVIVECKKKTGCSTTAGRRRHGR